MMKQICLLFILVLLFFLILLFSFKNEEISLPIIKLTLFEAVALAESTLSDKEFMLNMITSSDMDNPHSSDNGIDGRRMFWNMWFNKLDTDQYLSIVIINGEIIEIREFTGSNSGREELISSEDIIYHIDSPEALRLVLERFYLQPGIDWAIGHHFTLWRYPEGILMGVTGYDEQNQFSMAYVNLTTGEVSLRGEVR